jgi:hypothetical protein
MTWRTSLTPCLAARGRTRPRPPPPDGKASESVFRRTKETDTCCEVVTMPVKGDCACLDERTLVNGAGGLADDRCQLLLR